MALASQSKLQGGNVSVSRLFLDIANAQSTMLEQALAIFNGDNLYRNEIARTSYKLGCVLQDSGEISKGRELIQMAEELRRQILPETKDQDTDEDSFDKLVMFWSR